MAQYLTITDDTTFSDLVDRVGSTVANQIVTTNGLKRATNIGWQHKQKAVAAIKNTPDPSWQTKVTTLNTVTSDNDVFEMMALASNETWKCIVDLNTPPNMLKLPEGTTIPPAQDTLGGTGVSVSNRVYSETMKQLQTGDHTVNPATFNEYSSIAPNPYVTSESSGGSNSIYNMFNLPWGKITLFSSIDQTSIDFPVYPEEIDDNAKANYTTMPNLIYQYEPWYLYESSGPRQVSYTFKFHRDMWSGDHRDGKANELVRFCQACCYPEYNGSAVNAPVVTLYINGERHISGIMNSADPHWYGPIGLDGFYLACDLTINITEVSPTALSYAVMKSKSLIGG